MLNAKRGISRLSGKAVSGRFRPSVLVHSSWVRNGAKQRLDVSANFQRMRRVLSLENEFNGTSIDVGLKSFEF